MRRDWDERARKDAFYYIATWRQDWTPETFAVSGEEDYQRLVQPFLEDLQFVPECASMVEVGCGAGRMTASFARRFATVYALDISEEMQNLGRKNLAEFPNIHWVVADGTNLSAVPSDSADFVFSYLVLQHLPAERLALTYVREILRVLKQGGIFLFQFNAAKRPTMNWKGRLAWGAVDTLWAFNLRSLSRTTARWLGFDPETAGMSWRGASLSADKVVETIRAAGGSSVQVTGDGTAMAWCKGGKSLPASR
ncbi:MAG: class I SAM-dependent methyltransferase [Candidatus Acidiferrales bacterium]